MARRARGGEPPPALDRRLPSQRWPGVECQVGIADGLFAAPALHVAVESAVRHRRRYLIVDPSQVTFMSSAGINLMVNLRREYAPPHELHVVLNATVTRLWDLIGITDLFTIHPSRTAARRNHPCLTT